MEGMEFPCGSPPVGSVRSRPEGYSVCGDVPTPVVEQANRTLNNHSLGYGDFEVFSYKDAQYLLRVEPHCDDHIDGILHWRRGVTAYYQNIPPVVQLQEVVVEGEYRKLETGRVVPFETFFIFAPALVIAFLIWKRFKK
jgi:hypothetical protein